MLSKKLRKAFERECYYLEYYDKHRRFPFEKKKVSVTLSLDILDKFKDKIKNREFSEIVENSLIKEKI